MKSKRLAQAVIELGVFAGILLFLIITGVVMMLQVNNEVSGYMESFREALREARPLDPFDANRIKIAPKGHTLVEYKTQRTRGQSVSLSGLLTNRYRQFQSSSPTLNQHLSDAEVYWFAPTIAQLSGPRNNFYSVVGKQTKVMYKMNEDTMDITPFEQLADSTHNIVDKNIWLRIDSFFQWRRRNAIIDQAGISFRRKFEDVADILFIAVRDDKDWLGAIRQVLSLKRSFYGQKEREVYKIFEADESILKTYDINPNGVIYKKITEGIN